MVPGSMPMQWLSISGTREECSLILFIYFKLYLTRVAQSVQSTAYDINRGPGTYKFENVLNMKIHKVLQKIN